MIIIRKILIISFIVFSVTSYGSLPICNISNDKISKLFLDIQLENKKISSLDRCQSKNSFLLSILINKIDPHFIKYADISLRSNPSFFSKFIPLDYRIIQYASDSLKRDKRFILNIARNNIDILSYVNPAILDDIEFAKELIYLNPKSYIYLSNRLQKNLDLVFMALKLDPVIFSNISDNIRSKDEIIKEALISHPFNYELLTKKQQQLDWVLELKKLSDPDDLLFFKKYLKEQYANTNIGMSVNRGYKISYQSKNFKDHNIFSKEYPLKWQKYSTFKNDFGYKLVNNGIGRDKWQDNFDSYPKLVDKIQYFLSKRIDKLAIDSLVPISIWKISDQEVVFNLYSIRTIYDEEIDEEIININSLTAIAVNDNDDWQLTIIDVIYDANIKTDISYNNGHKRFYIWDLYEDKDKNISIIFKIEDRYSQYFKIYQRDSLNKFKEFYQLGGYYEHIVIDPENK